MSSLIYISEEIEEYIRIIQPDRNYGFVAVYTPYELECEILFNKDLNRKKAVTYIPCIYKGRKLVIVEY